MACKRKRIILISIVAVVFIVSFVLVCIWTLWKLPKGCDTIHFEIGCAKLDDSGDIKWTTYRDELYLRIDDHNKEYMHYLAFLFNTLPKEKTNDKITDFQIVNYSFRDYDDPLSITNRNYKEMKNIYFAYDFYQQNIYFMNEKDGVWYLVTDTEKLDGEIVELMDHIFEFSKNWMGQNDYCFEDFDRSDLDEYTFRYDLYWKPTDYELPAKTSGFLFVDGLSIIDEDSIIKRAATELGCTNYLSKAYSDETNGYWMIEILDISSFDSGSGVSDISIFVSENTKTVIFDKNGITLEVYNNFCVGYNYYFSRLYPLMQEDR